jgi:hypothetical protein
MSARFYRNPDGTGFAGGLPCQAPSDGERPRASPEGPCGAGIGHRRGCRRASGDLFSGSLTDAQDRDRFYRHTALTGN